MARPPDILPRRSPQWMPAQLAWPHLLHFVANRAPILLLLVMNSIVLYNALVHPPLAGYDAGSHLGYILTLAEGRLPTPFDTSEFFSPPLPYALPALAYAGGLPWGLTQKSAQLLNLLISLGTVFALLRLAHLIRPRQIRYTAATLAVLALMPVYYKSFSFIRGEPWVTLFAVLIAYEALSMILNEDTGRKLTVRAVRLGIWLGLAVLSRQWGFLLWIAVALFWLGLWWQRTRSRSSWRLNQVGETLPGTVMERRKMIQAALLASLVALMIGGWFYFHLHWRYESVAAFNRPLQSSLSLANHPPSFYTGLGDGKLFTDPVRPSFSNQLWPKFYAEFWGDYEAYFLIYGRDLRTNHFLPGHQLEEAMAANKQGTDGAILGTCKLDRFGHDDPIAGGFCLWFFILLALVENKEPGQVNDFLCLSLADDRHILCRLLCLYNYGAQSRQWRYDQGHLSLAHISFCRSLNSRVHGSNSAPDEAWLWLALDNYHSVISLSDPNISDALRSLMSAKIKP